MYGRLFSGTSGLLVSVVVFLGFSCTSHAQTIPAGLNSSERTALAESFATQRLAVWQNRLNLNDWNVSVVVARTSDLKPRTLGNIHWDTDKKTAVIRVLDPADYKLSDEQILPDIEFTVVHELIHLELVPVLAPLQRNDANRREEEHTVNHIADALLHLDGDSAKSASACPSGSQASQPATAGPNGTASRSKR
jgi:hypothetical protein